MDQVFEVDALFNTHCHLREGDVVGPLIERAIQGGADYILPMPNTQRGLLTAEETVSYIYAAKKSTRGARDVGFVPIFMINERTTVEMVDECAKSGIMDAKIYPLDRTTKSHNGVSAYMSLLPVIKRCGEREVRVHVHPEHPWMIFDNRDAEFAFLPIVRAFLEETDAVIIWEHGSDARCIPFWKEMAQSGRFFLTLTAHHLAADEDSTFGDVRAVCKPPIKTRRDRHDLARLVEEDHRWIMAGLDDAPHDVSSKHVPAGTCACGAYTAPFGHQLYAHALDGLLHQPEGVEVYQNFTSRNARRLYQVRDASRKVRLVRQEFQIPAKYGIGEEWDVQSFWAKKKILYSLA